MFCKRETHPKKKHQCTHLWYKIEGKKRIKNINKIFVVNYPAAFSGFSIGKIVVRIWLPEIVDGAVLYGMKRKIAQ